MKQIIRCLVLALSLCLAVASTALAGELEDKLFDAAINGQAVAVRALLEKGADVNAKDSDGATALILAAYYGYADVVKVLIEKGADLNVKDRAGQTALDKAEAKHKSDIVNMLRSAISSSVARTANPKETLNQYIAELRKKPYDSSLRKQIILVANAMKPPPVIPDQARRSFVQGNTILKAARNTADYNLAVEKYNEALIQAPWWGDAYNNLAIALNSAGRPDAAKQAMELYIFTKPKDADQAQNKIYEIEAQQELQAERKSKFEQEVNLGVAAYGKGPDGYDEAIARWKKALELYPEHPEILQVYRNLTQVYYDRKNWDETLKYIQKVLESTPDNPEVNGRMGYVLDMRGDLPKACIYYKKACDLGFQVGCNNRLKRCP